MKRSEAGSILVEAIIAAGIVAVMMAALYTSIAGSAQRQQMVSDRRLALLVARSELATIGEETPATVGTTTGISGDYGWRIDIAPYGGDLTPSAAGPLGIITVQVFKGGQGRSLATLRTLRVMPSGPPHA
jgi:type II secretory pathway pseudopilin PulG